MAIWLESLNSLEGFSRTVEAEKARKDDFGNMTQKEWRLYVAKRLDSVEKRLILLDEKVREDKP